MSLAARGASVRRFMAALAAVGLVGLVVYLLAERNSRRWFLVQEDGTLYVKKGVLFPVGRLAFETSDPELSRAYAPLVVPPGVKLDEARSFDDRAALDQALYEMLARWARGDVSRERPESIERALAWIGRAECLQGLSAAQRDDLKALRAESGFFEARRFLATAANALRQARERLQRTAGSSSSHAGDAGEALKQVEPAIDDVSQAGRLLTGAASSPRPPEAEPQAPGAATPANPGGASVRAGGGAPGSKP